MTPLLLTAWLFVAQDAGHTQPVTVQLTRLVELRTSDFVARQNDLRFDPDGEPRLIMTLELRGPLAAEAYRYGFIDATCRSAEGLELAPLALGTAHAHPIDHFVDIDRGMMFAFEERAPADVIRLELGFQPPPRAARQLALTGRVALLAAETQQQITFEDVRNRAAGPLDHPVLARAGLAVALQKKAAQPTSFYDPARGVLLEIVGPGEAVTAMELIDAQGRTVDTIRTWQSVGSHTAYTLQGFETLPDTVHLRLTVAVGQKRVDVPFEFNTIGLP